MKRILDKLENRIYDSTGFYPSWLMRRWWWNNQAEKVGVSVLGPRMFKLWYDAGSQLALVLGNTLVYWSSHAMSHPPQYSMGEWKGLLHAKGTALLLFHEDDEEDPEKIEAAKEALHWVADNLDALWD